MKYIKKIVVNNIRKKENYVNCDFFSLLFTRRRMYARHTFYARVYIYNILIILVVIYVLLLYGLYVGNFFFSS